jgi:CubicO group peptidase (beta-lactamase class C family)
MRSWYQPDKPGAAVIVLQNNEVIFSNARGLADMEHSIPITPHTAFELASCSKQFTGYALAMLLDRGRVSLEDDIRKYLPELPEFEQPITVEHLIYHTSGLRDWDDISNAMGFKPEDIMTLDMIYRITCNTQEQLFPSNDRFNYCNTGYNLLALLVERATGMTFGTWMADHVFAPLGMNDTFIRDDLQKNIPGKANSYKLTAAGFDANAYNTSAPGSTSVYSSIDDLGRWINNFTSGKVGGAGVLALLNRKTRTNDGKEIPFYAFGNSFGSHKGIYKIEHLGLTSGFRANLTRYPEQNLAFVYLSNDNNDATFSRSWAIADVFLQGQKSSPLPPVKFPDLAEALAQTEPYHVTKCPVPTTEYTGVYYADEINSHYRLVEKAGVLMAISYRFTEIDLTWQQPDTFLTNFETFRRNVIFHRDAADRVTSLALTDGDKDIVFRKLE